MDRRIIPVVAAVFRVPASKGFHESRFLLHQKDEPRNNELVGRWEFPGGMMEYGEVPEEALRREIWEELGKEVTVGSLFYAQTNIYNDSKHYLVLFYHCQLFKRLPDIKGCRWLTWAEMDTVVTLPGTQEAVRKSLGI
ncbi:hypothetical protein ES705_32620 [subsurface metagenome]